MGLITCNPIFTFSGLLSDLVLCSQRCMEFFLTFMIMITDSLSTFSLKEPSVRA